MLARGSVANPEGDFFLIATGSTVSGFGATLDGHALRLVLTGDREIQDEVSGTRWDLRGRYLVGPLRQDLTPVPVSDEYWFSWAKFHPRSTLVRLEAQAAQAQAAAPVLQP